MARRNLLSQFMYAISEHQRFGKSKRGERIQDEKLIKEGKLKDKRIDTAVYSIGRSDGLKDMARIFSNYMKRQYPDIWYVRDITSHHVQMFIAQCAQKNNCTQKTCIEYRSRLKKINAIVIDQYNAKDWNCEDVIIPNCIADALRIQAMECNDYKMLLNSFYSRESKSDGVVALEITGRTGLRVSEVATLTGNEIDLAKKRVRVIQGKNGKNRNVPIRDKDIEYFENLKARVGEGRVTPHVSPYGNKGGQSLDKAIRTEMRRIGISKKYEDTTDHCVRKMYALERMEELTSTTERNNPLENEAERKAWTRVQKELGHGNELRMELYTAYTCSL